MTARRFERWLTDAIEEHGDRNDPRAMRVSDVETFAEAGMLTNDRGLVVRFVDGSEIQITLVQSRRGRDEEE